MIMSKRIICFFNISKGVLYDGTITNLYLSLVNIVFILLNKKVISLSEKE